MPRRGLVVDDHTYMRQALRQCLLEAGLDEVLEAATLEEARQVSAQHGVPEVVVLDLRLPDGSGLEALPELRARGSRVVVFTSNDDSYSVRSAYAAGAAGYLLKSASHDAMVAAMRQVLSGQLHVDPAVAGLLVESVQAAPQADKALTPREIEILQLAAAGMTNAEIADSLQLTALSVKGHLVRIGRKLGAKDRTHMVAEAMRADLLR